MAYTGFSTLPCEACVVLERLSPFAAKPRYATKPRLPVERTEYAIVFADWCP